MTIALDRVILQFIIIIIIIAIEVDRYLLRVYYHPNYPLIHRKGGRGEREREIKTRVINICEE